MSSTLEVIDNPESQAIESNEKPLSFKRNSVLILDDEQGIRNFLQKGLEKVFGLVEVAEDVEEAEALRQRCNFDLIISDIRLPGKSGVDWVTEIRSQGSTTSVIFITAHASLETAIAALRVGASDFIMKPFRMDQMMASIESCMAHQQMQRENIVLKRQVDQLYDSGMIGDCDTMKSVCEVIKRIAPMPTTVLIGGESGTGKELAARALHRWSGRKGSFVPVNCGAITEELMESEFFGHTKGAFTGAQKTREGLFTYANNGTLFLDEIGEMPMSMQVHLLRVLEEKVIRPVGSNRQIPVDVRIIAASNRDLEEEVEKGNFRQDLYYRLNVVNVRMPPLRERMDDIPALVQHFSQTLSSDLGVDAQTISGEDLHQMRDYHWPGNIRELRNVIERCLLLNLKPGQCISAEAGESSPAGSVSNSALLEDIEKNHILKVLESEDGNKSAAARILGVSRKTLERKVKAWNEL
ncbi:sigma-54 dependent transcriptional regulator [Cocleimonas sp. KMM 6892]|uniref:sigma-54-dependent transcriptional regulator n=1 Tax=unclassified Cocleimonas TaxID=2639732 RepID=UPI002DBFBB39|nr:MULTISPECIES: sigma-54 dependent transcriptional regulator [unclassified Cocleimonas]MEB8434174.1 sigma-54 dependent transcriptional regulator [Cocleimonas sp. KMM 6892]MEC4716966.1 sigma-54 dependent transcriptional regulator [Cocleimonas sp. KMM 6895]MEC4746446.1 sigma-54 dependent transcriptional regulator [Cocleimonas sp. KMM 6896]